MAVSLHKWNELFRNLNITLTKYIGMQYWPERTNKS